MLRNLRQMMGRPLHATYQRPRYGGWDEDVVAGEPRIEPRA